MSSKIIGSILIVAGTAIGGGMLAMPIISAGVGFGGITIVLFLIWLAMCYTSLLFVKIYKYNPHDVGLNTLTQKYLGKTGSFITAVSMLTLMYALISAYITGGGAIISTNLKLWCNISIPPTISALIFTLLFGGIVSLGTKLVDLTTKWIFTIKLIFLLVVIVALIPFVKAENLATLPVERALIFAAIPVIFTSFGFHVVIPSLVSYLKGDYKQLRLVMIVGSLIPLVIYLIWELSVLGSIDNSIFLSILQNNAGLEGLILSIRQISNAPVTNIAVNVFAAAAILTSFLGVALALYDYIKDLGKNNKWISNSYGSISLTFLPSLGFAIYYPEGFILALSYASISLVILSLILPVLMLIKAKKAAQEKISLGMKISFFGIFLLSMVIFGTQVLIALGKIPNVG
ncbi:aromatic amino acid transport family protein [Flavobacterium sp. NKUCC04_CG]|uniref:aromatic amino acid transport family protein n=1 Tax=Flavobacterium sp. NKUCC04_CG TaxID=2842121 RepID=UPI001C5B32D4|nr:tyrosine transporter TyrP [Flavobacterium sp. NKUCC04_CG]